MLVRVTDMAVVPVQDFLKNNRGIDDGSDLPVDYMSALYDRIINNEIKMKVCPLTISRDPLLKLHMHSCQVLPSHLHRRGLYRCGYLAAR